MLLMPLREKYQKTSKVQKRTTRNQQCVAKHQKPKSATLWVFFWGPCVICRSRGTEGGGGQGGGMFAGRFTDSDVAGIWEQVLFLVMLGCPSRALREREGLPLPCTSGGVMGAAAIFAGREQTLRFFWSQIARR